MIGDKWPHTGAVLAGGQSQRFGSPKHNLVLGDGATFLESICNSLGEVCSDIVVVGYVESGFQQIPDLRRGYGPLGGIEALLASGLDSDYLVCPVDMPLLTPAMLLRLTESAASPLTIFGIESSDKMETLPVRISSSILPEVTSALDSKQPALHDLWARLGVEKVLIPADDARLLVNVNTVDDYRMLDPKDLF